MSSEIPVSTIRTKLEELCDREGVKSIFAVESGSRAWGFASPDSDYDVRFVYIRPTKDYLLLDRPRDVIEHMDQRGMLDLVGWDLVKALKLLGNSNPSIIEWLETEQAYQADDESVAILRDVARQSVSSKALVFHYISVAQDHMKKYVRNQKEVAPKKYLYAFRGVLSADYVLRNSRPAPILFQALRDESELMREQPKIATLLDKLIELKGETAEKKKLPIIPALDEFVEEQADRLLRLAQTSQASSNRVESEVLNRAFEQLRCIHFGGD
jgi:predicted nucleotidyltransferase